MEGPTADREAILQDRRTTNETGTKKNTQKPAKDEGSSSVSRPNIRDSAPPFTSISLLQNRRRRTPIRRMRH
jgi:hypothetical protein